MAAATDETGRGTMRNHKTPAGETAGSERRDARGRLMSCAVAEFMEKGFAGASLRSIAAAADMTTGAIYGYFSGKEALFDAVVAPAADELTPATRAPRTGSTSSLSRPRRSSG